MSSFIDRVHISVFGGDGGDGCSSVLREKFKPLGGPDGGNGGHGGSVILRASDHLYSLLDFRYQSHYRAGHGRPGEGNNKTGARGKDIIAQVPVGTLVKSSDDAIIADLTQDGQECVIAAGGVGGLGNAALASRQRKAPGFALRGEPGQSGEFFLELKLLADVGLVGFPSAGKSSLISVISSARPKIADYPFTTLRPHLGVVDVDGCVFTVADVPGLIPGASEGKGLGYEFLRHIERCSAIAHVVDMANFDLRRDPVSDIRAIENELAQYESRSEGKIPSSQSDATKTLLAERSRVIILNKFDIPDARDLYEIVLADLQQFQWPIFAVSAVTQSGLAPLLYALRTIIEKDREHRHAQAPARPVISLAEKTVDKSFTVDRQKASADEDAVYVVRGYTPERWVRQTPFDNDEAVGYLADRLFSLGIEAALAKHGAKPGDEVRIGAFSFTYEPDIGPHSGAKLSGRGTDARLNTTERVGADERKKARDMRRWKRRERQTLADAREPDTGII